MAQEGLAQSVDAAFAALNISGTVVYDAAQRPSNRQYQGELRGRRLEAQFRPASNLGRGQPSRLILHLGAQAGAQMLIQEKESQADSLFLAALVGWIPLLFGSYYYSRRRVGVHDPDFDRLSVYSDYEGWVRSLLNDPRARAALLRLNSPGERYERREFETMHDAVIASRFNFTSLSPDGLQQALEDLLEVAEGAEHLPPPSGPTLAASNSISERFNRLPPAQRLVTVAGPLLAGGLCALCFCAIVATSAMQYR